MMTEKEVLDSLALFKNALHKLKDQNASIQSSYDELKAKYDNLASTHDSDVETKDKEIEGLKKDIQLKTLDLADFKDKTLKTIRHLVEDNIEPKDIKLEELETAYDKAKKDLEELTAKYQKLSTDFDSLSESKRTQQNERSLELDSKNKDLEKKDQELLSLRETFATWQKERDEDKNSINVLKKTIEEKQILFNDSTNAKDQEIANLKARAEALQNTIEENKKKAQDELASTVASKDKAFTELSDASFRRESEYKAQIEELNRKLNKKETQFVDSNTKIKELYKKIENYKSAAQNYANKAAEATAHMNNSIPNYPVIYDKPQDSTKQVYYRFGRATERIKDELVQFITQLYNGIDDTHAPYQLISIETAAQKANISDKTRNVFIKRLYEMTSNNQHLIYDKDGHICSDFTRDYMIEYVTALSPAAN